MPHGPLLKDRQQYMSTQEPFYFGQQDQLFGIYHAAEGTPKRNAVLIVSPLLNESMRAHFALRQIAQKLSSTGHDVLRFDFAGMGNSLLTAEEVSVPDWQQNVLDAATELMDISGASTLSVVAVRYGAALSMALTRTLTIRKFVLWDPLIRGSEWLAHLRIAQVAAQEKVPTVKLDTARVFSGHVVNPDFVTDVGGQIAAWPSDIEAVIMASTGNKSELPGDYSNIEQRDVDFQCSWESMSSQVLYPHRVIADVCQLL